MRIAAHRGVHHDVPENSVAAFEAAITIGADSIEFDVRLTRDGIAVVTHDLGLERSVGISGTVFEKDLVELQRVPLVGSPEGAPLFIPTLDEVVDRFAGRIGLEIELKDPLPELPVAVARTLERHREHWESIEVTSFEPASLAHLSSLVSGAIRTCVLTPPSEAWMTPAILAYLAVGKVRLAGASAVHLHPTQLSEEVVDGVRSAGLEIHAWGVSDDATFEAASRFGITHCDSDQPERLLALRAAR